MSGSSRKKVQSSWWTTHPLDPASPTTPPPLASSGTDHPSTVVPATAPPAKTGVVAPIPIAPIAHCSGRTSSPGLLRGGPPLLRNAPSLEEVKAPRHQPPAQPEALALSPDEVGAFLMLPPTRWRSKLLPLIGALLLFSVLPKLFFPRIGLVNAEKSMTCCQILLEFMLLMEFNELLRNFMTKVSGPHNTCIFAIVPMDRE